MFESLTNSSKPEKKINDDWCNRILYDTIHSKTVFVPSHYLLTIPSQVFAECTTGVLRSFISMFLTMSFLRNYGNNTVIEILWLAWRCFVLSVELCVISFALFSAQVDSRFGVRKVLLISSVIAFLFTATQAFLEFKTKKSNIYGGKYALFEHGGMVFWFASSITFGTIYFLIVTLPFTRLSRHHTFPAKKSFYCYCTILAAVNILQSVGSGLVAFSRKPVGVCLVDVTTISYFTLFAPLVYYTFLSDFLGSNTDYLLTASSTTSETYQPIPDKLLEGQGSGDEGSDDDEDDEYVPRHIQYGTIT
ncbi:hypothetical protein QZH41_015422 [Actinostola sp. cb2023]|nr:hypothetical protein QZH41_015422 [Actinostola sp. cb2023]